MPYWSSWKNVPPSEQNYLINLVNVWEQTIGYQVPMDEKHLLVLANMRIQTQQDLGRVASTYWGSEFSKVLQTMPWALYGLDKDTYASMSETFGTEYKKITGQDISSSALQEAFQNPRDTAGGLLTSSQYAQQLMNDTAIQKQYGWVKYGLDYTQWTQQKLQLQTAFGRSVNDAEAATILQYDKPASGANVTAIGRAAGQQQGQPQTGVTGSLAR